MSQTRSYLSLYVTITILDIIHRPTSYLKHDFSETGFYSRLQVAYTQLDLINRASLYLDQEIETTFIYGAQMSRFHLKAETESSLRNVVF
jgi:hypothetical protein